MLPYFASRQVGFLEEVRDPVDLTRGQECQTNEFACYFSYDPIWVIFYGSSTAAAIQTSTDGLFEKTAETTG